MVRNINGVYDATEGGLKNMIRNVGQKKDYYGLEILHERDASLRAFQVVFIDSRGAYDVGGMLYVPDKWLRDRGLSIERDGMIYHTLMTIYAAYWTATVEEAGLSYFAYTPPHNLIDGVDMTGYRKDGTPPLWEVYS